MIKKTPFYIYDVLDEVLYFSFKNEGIASAYWTKDKEPMTLKSIIERNLDDERVFPQYHALKKENDSLKAEIERLTKELEPFKKNKGKGRTKGTFKLSEFEIHQVKALYYAGNSKRAIARKYKVDEKTIRNILKI